MTYYDELARIKQEHKKACEKACGELEKLMLEYKEANHAVYREAQATHSEIAKHLLSI